ncbi:MAG: hypothetical protein D3915_11325 [Candidatus Electrothrix sp. AU1_5]|nr:hypothetical protein [Candidatus Electrothrix sp. AX1]MCI5128004.1 hypothetical protein [Candidatus Electrothrix gigas]MCI5182940.1 hypothetical protein [Candidatus Electrothrix gigas]MCI5193695.1 hypothetical protein [Candidatus Electrothrix gigas]MCI5225290.1 hypothetical protein [Candidatus Electrothrix gigas]
MMKEKKNSNALHAALDPGYLMLAVYVLSVTFLVLFAWLGGSNAALEDNHQKQDQVVAHELVTEQHAPSAPPVTLADYFIHTRG